LELDEEEEDDVEEEVEEASNSAWSFLASSRSASYCAAGEARDEGL
jgi:hypothetical protein